MSSIFGFGSSSAESKPKSSVKPINKRDIVDEIASTHDLSIAKSERIVNTVFDTIVEAVVDGKQVRLSGFGSFESYMSKARSGRNPNTGESIEIGARRRIRFKAYDAFKNA
jgi:nucleoid DNA-binding protein